MTVQVLHVFATFGPGGPQVRAAQLMARMGDVRHGILAMDGDTSCRDRLPAADAVTWLEPPAAVGLAGTVRAMMASLRQLRPDLVLTYNWGAIESVLAARLGGRRVVHHEDGFGPEEAVRRLRRRRWLRRLLLPGTAGVVVPSAGLLGIASAEWRVPAPILHHLPNGVDLQRFRPRPGAGDRGVVIGHVGGLRPEKDQVQLLRALSRMRHRDRSRLLIVGDGPLRAELEAVAGELGLGDRVAFRGAVADPAACYREMDVFALSSRTEQMPLAVLEAMASGLPVVSTRVGDVPLMLPGDDGLVVDADPGALAAALDRLAGAPELRAELGAANRRRCEERYELEACLGRYLAVYRSALPG